MHFAALELDEEFSHRLGLGHAHGHAQQAGELEVLGLVAEVTHQVLHVQDPDDRIEAVAVDRDPAVASTEDELPDDLQVAGVGQALDRRARRHHFAHERALERDDVFHHRGDRLVDAAGALRILDRLEQFALGMHGPLLGARDAADGLVDEAHRSHERPGEHPAGPQHRHAAHDDPCGCMARDRARHHARRQPDDRRGDGQRNDRLDGERAIGVTFVDRHEHDSQRTEPAEGPQERDRLLERHGFPHDPRADRTAAALVQPALQMARAHRDQGQIERAEVARQQQAEHQEPQVHAAHGRSSRA